MSHSPRHVTLSLGPRQVSVCEECLQQYVSYAAAARAAYAAANKRNGGRWPAADYTGVAQGATAVPQGKRCDLDERPPADPVREEDYRCGRLYWVFGPATPGARPSCQHQGRLTLEAARMHAGRVYGDRRDLVRHDVRIERDSGALEEYHGPLR